MMVRAVAFMRGSNRRLAETGLAGGGGANHAAACESKNDAKNNGARGRAHAESVNGFQIPRKLAKKIPARRRGFSLCCC
jgi:hypothetical protein